MVSLLSQPISWESQVYQNERKRKKSSERPVNMASSTSHKYTFALQKYLLLQEQHEELVAHLDQIRPSPSPPLMNDYASPTRSSSISSASSSSSSTSHSMGGHSRKHTRRSRPPPCSYDDFNNRRLSRSDTLDTIPDEETMFAISTEERRLFDVNESMKRALTELLNCEAVRADNRMRMWVQGRLMEVEKELRSGRRRKNSVE
jgi:hypothetical protein